MKLQTYQLELSVKNDAFGIKEVLDTAHNVHRLFWLGIIDAIRLAWPNTAKVSGFSRPSVM